MKTVIVFGATGNLGAYVALHLKAVGYDVIAVGHRKNDNGFFASKGMKYYSVDIMNPEEFKQLPSEHIDCVAHFAGELPSRYSFDAAGLVKSITIGTLNVLEYMRSCGCKKIIFPQTPSDMCKYHILSTIHLHLNHITLHMSLHLWQANDKVLNQIPFFWHTSHILEDQQLELLLYRQVKT